jgi:hypothetical protein
MVRVGAVVPQWPRQSKGVMNCNLEPTLVVEGIDVYPLPFVYPFNLLVRAWVTIWHVA